MERISTGVTALDHILNGGIPQGSTVLVAGRPGSGKTILATQMMFHNAGPESKVIYLTTLGEPQVKVLRYQQEFSFFDPVKVQDSVIYYDLGSPLRKGGPKQVLEIIDRLLKTHQPRLLIIDTIKSLSEIIGSLMETREFVLDLTLRICMWDCTTLLLGEYSEEDIEIQPESAIADGIIYISGNEEKKFQRRFLRILKMRGTRYVGGENIFTISDSGITLFPRINPVVNTQQYGSTNQRISSGLPSLDEMMGGGIPQGTTTLISGGPGTGKTIMAEYFAWEGLRQGDPVILITFEEHPHQLVQNAASLGMDLSPYVDSGQLFIDHVSPIEISIDEYIHHVQQKVIKTGARRVIVDSISSFEVGMSDKIQYTDHIWSLCDNLKTLGVSILLTHETPYGSISMATKHGISYIADNMVSLRYKEEEESLNLSLRIVKMRGSSHSYRPGEVSIGPEGLQITPL
ncbi:MAG TPA: ATPase domain-containing protein [Syntrophomonadaceae bacterium]|nr:ATPase domain-containing protein [Syntrophomonadaceae bacterium]